MRRTTRSLRSDGTRNRDIGFSHRQADLRRIWDQFHQDVRVMMLKRHEAGREDVDRERFRAGDPHHALQLVLVSADRALDRQGFRLDPLGLRLDTLARQRQPVALGCPVEQPNRQVGLERRQSTPDGRLRHAQLLCGSRQAAMAGDGEEEAKIVPVQHKGPYAKLLIRNAFSRDRER